MTQPLPIVGYINPLVADALRDLTSGINVTQLRAERNGPVSAPLVLKTDADTEIAKRDAEIARLNDALCGIIDTAHNPSKTVWVRIEAVQKEAEEALKGSEA
ncbi:hypothetical protein [Acetobacter ascendens]|uniref:hypothetical protein n=1 Tax=Acetobacter ascendens TaxID=481146 RepID=UPI000875BD3F|nr:hypothetical protein [Acetobacter ascendens]AOW48414.1 hypothetical protein A4R89_02175 [Acetobacter ascendens]